MNNKGTTYSLILGIIILLLMGCNLFFGSVDIPAEAVIRSLMGEEVEKASWNFIVWEARVPQAITALLCGAALAGSGLMLQTAFNNPLAGPSILGINSGASLGVALVMLLGGGTIATAGITLSGFFSIVLGAFIGSMVVMGLILFFSTLIKSNIMLLITGIMIGYITSSAISLLNFFATAEGVHSYMIWGMGNFSGVSLEQMPYFAIFTLSGLTLAILLIKPLNALLLGTRYAENLGVNIKRTRNLLLIATGILILIPVWYFLNNASGDNFRLTGSNRGEIYDAIAALKKHRLVGYYMDRIHTRRDTVFMEENIVFLRDSTQALVQKLISGGAGE